MGKITRLALFSDSHMYESKDPLKKKLPGKNTKGEQIINADTEQNETKFILALEKAKGIDGISHLFFGGDMVTGYGERGATGPDSLEHMLAFKRLLNENFRGVPWNFMAGGHELGYRLPLSTDPEGGINEKAISVFEQEFGELFYTFEIGRYKFVVLSSDLELYEGKKTNKILKLKNLQHDFYRDEISFTTSGQKIVLMLHDPDALVPMFPFLKENLGKIEMTFSGHQHARWVNKLYPILCRLASADLLKVPLKNIFNHYFPNKADDVWEYFLENKNNAQIWKALNLQIIPAPGGMFGIGGGFLIADIGDEGIKLRRVKI